MHNILLFTNADYSPHFKGENLNLRRSEVQWDSISIVPNDHNLDNACHACQRIRAHGFGSITTKNDEVDANEKVRQVMFDTIGEA